MCWGQRLISHQPFEEKSASKWKSWLRLCVTLCCCFTISKLSGGLCCVVKEQTAMVEQAIRCIELRDQHHISQALHDSLPATGTLLLLLLLSYDGNTYHAISLSAVNYVIGSNNVYVTFEYSEWLEFIEMDSVTLKRKILKCWLLTSST